MFDNFRRKNKGIIRKLLLVLIIIYGSLLIIMPILSMISEDNINSDDENNINDNIITKITKISTEELNKISTTYNTTTTTITNISKISVSSTSTFVTETKGTTVISEVQENEDINSEEYEENEDTYNEINVDESNQDISEDTSYAGYFIAKWYDNLGMGYTEGSTCFGYSGRDLISGYSIASNYFAQGTLLYIKGGSHDGYYRVDDTGYMGSDTIDFYYSCRSDVPDQFCSDGVQDIEVWVIN